MSATTETVPAIPSITFMTLMRTSGIVFISTLPVRRLLLGTPRTLSVEISLLIQLVVLFTVVLVSGAFCQISGLSLAYIFWIYTEPRDMTTKKVIMLFFILYRIN